MNGIHDMGGMHGFGPISREANEPVFHAPWEGRVLAISLLAGARSIDYRRHAIERMEPANYLASTYYERWLAGFLLGARESGNLTDDEIAEGVPAGRESEATPLTPEIIENVIRTGGPSTRATGRLERRFAVGDRVRARNMHPEGHTRLPRYVRGHVGTVAGHRGTHVFPDTNAHKLGEQPQPLYSVRFESTTLWGASGTAGDSLYIDLWEDYLDSVQGLEP